MIQAFYLSIFKLQIIWRSKLDCYVAFKNFFPKKEFLMGHFFENDYCFHFLLT